MKMTKNPNNKIPFPELRGDMNSVLLPAFCDIKYDGELNLFEKMGDKGVLINKYGTTREDCPITEDLNRIFKDHQGVRILGELVIEDGKNGDLYKMLSKKMDDNLKFMAFDMPMFTNEDGVNAHASADLLVRKEALIDFIQGQSTNVGVARTFYVDTAAEIQNIFNQVVNLGYEGIVIKYAGGEFKNGPMPWCKMKMKDQTEYEVTLIDKVKDRIEVAIPDANGNITMCGVKAVSQQKALLKLGDKVIIEHQGVLSKGALRHPVLIGRA